MSICPKASKEAVSSKTAIVGTNKGRKKASTPPMPQSLSDTTASGVISLRGDPLRTRESLKRGQFLPVIEEQTTEKFHKSGLPWPAFPSWETIHHSLSHSCCPGEQWGSLPIHLSLDPSQCLYWRPNTQNHSPPGTGLHVSTNKTGKAAPQPVRPGLMGQSSELFSVL